MADWFIYGNNLIWNGISVSELKETVLEETKIHMMEFKEFKQLEVSNRITTELSETYMDYRNVFHFFNR